ncbi:alkaline phosphatase [Halyomorpha halys]|uniref:alkaline phosphatase n=1 Tax=Halyomorpha halys TaxID=286706 RepID=UPI0006D4D476|nr:alkaline phosphatase-like [Halyomorpha halys]
MFVYLVFLACFGSVLGFEDLDENYWRTVTMEDLHTTLNFKHNFNIAKNVIIFIGDGMGPYTITAARIYSEGETGYLSWEKFPHIGAVKTYTNNYQVPDSAATATAIYTGVKVNQGTLGVDVSVKRGDCNASLVEKSHLETLATLGQRAGKATGIVTTTRITHATPGAMYAHTAERDWECDSVLPAGKKCKDIARQLFEDNPGKSFNVIMGGGRQLLNANAPNHTYDPIVVSSSTCVRTDGRDLMKEWADGKAAEGARYAVVENAKELSNLDTENTDYLLGIFVNDHFPYDHLRNKSENGVPSLEQMVTSAVKVLKKNENGFVLMVEGGMIDKAHHLGKARAALDEVVELSKAVNATMRLLETAGIKDDTLVIVTSDHSHTLTIIGYPDRGANILGVADTSRVDGVPFTTLNYVNAKKENYHYKVVNGQVVRDDPTLVDTTSYDYDHPAAIVDSQNSHGGSDVFVYATGPQSHLFHNIHEQPYIHMAIKYAMRLDEFATVEQAQQTSGSSKFLPSLIVLFLVKLFF